MTTEQLTADLAASRAMVIALQLKLTEALEKIAEKLKEMKTICQHNCPSDICGVCNPIASKPLSTGMRECYAAFMALYPWREINFPTYEAWILSDDYAALIFRQGWAARAGKDW